MAELDCTICLEQLKTPVAIPCGHVHCDKCLSDHIRAGNDAIRALCPTCRAPFSIVRPDLAYVPKKLHEFILPPVRRIYIDAAASTVQADLRKQVSLLSSRVKVLEREKVLLFERCEGATAAARIHAEVERQTRAEVMEAREERAVAKEETAKTKDMFISLMRKYTELKDRMADMELMKAEASKRKSAESPSFVFDANAFGPEIWNQKPKAHDLESNHRVIKSLPQKRPSRAAPSPSPSVSPCSTADCVDADVKAGRVMVKPKAISGSSKRVRIASAQRDAESDFVEGSSRTFIAPAPSKSRYTASADPLNLFQGRGKVAVPQRKGPFAVADIDSSSSDSTCPASSPAAKGRRRVIRQIVSESEEEL